MSQSVARSSLGLKVAAILKAARALGAPVDLFAVARACRVQSTAIRKMIPRGGMEAVEGGFRIYIRGDENRELALDEAEIAGLTNRQRFTLAHELGHTLFFDWTRSRPRPLEKAPKNQELEDLCDIAAANLLVPIDYLWPRVKARYQMSTNDVLSWAEEFRVSAEMMVGQIALAGCPAVDRVLIVARKLGGSDAQVRRSWFGAEFGSLLRRPRDFQRLSHAADVLAMATQKADGDVWQATCHGRQVRVQRVPHPRSPGYFFVEAQVE